MNLVLKKKNVNTSPKHLKCEGRKNILFYFKKNSKPQTYSHNKMKESPKIDPMLGKYQILNIPAGIDIECRNLNLGLATKVACKGAGQEGSPRVTSYAFGSVEKCEGMNLHIPK